MDRSSSLQTRVWRGALLSLLPMIVATSAAVVTLAQSLDSFALTVDEAINEALPLANLQNDLLDVQLAGLRAVTDRTPSSAAAYAGAREEIAAEFELLDGGDGFTEERSTLGSAQRSVQEAVRLIDRALTSTAAQPLTPADDTSARDLFDSAGMDLQAAERLSEADIVQEYDTAREQQRAALIGVASTALLGLVIAATVGAHLARSVLRPLRLLREAVHLLGAGRLSARVHLINQDEFGELAAAFNTMAADIERSQADLAHHGLHDALTGLPNRVLLTDRTQLALSRGSRTGRQIALLLIDLDGFKAVNDGLGHVAGDALLQQVADRILLCLRQGDTAARIGGDEFAVLIEANDLEEVYGIGERVLRSMRPAFTIEGEDIHVTASIGIAVAVPDGSSTPETLVRDADIAMYRAKNQGKDDLCVYDPTLQQTADARRQLDNDLHGALGRGELLLHYQPICAIGGEPVIAVEALMRWDHPTRGWVPPDVFIPLAESNGLINVLGSWALEEACRQLNVWRTTVPGSGTAELQMSVNISVRQLQDDNFAAEVAAVLTAYGIRPDRLILEITEGTIIDDIPTTIARLHELKAVGVQLAIDDFGTGYSSLSYLQLLPIDRIKVDKSFVDQLHTPQGRALVEGVLTLAQSLTLEPIAEGIEHEHQRTTLDALGCRLGQGYLFARPQSSTDITNLLVRSGRPAQGLQRDHQRPTAGPGHEDEGPRPMSTTPTGPAHVTGSPC